MRLYFTGIVLCAILLPGIALATPVQRHTLQATISQVTVYQDRAQVSRSAAVKLSPGSSILVIEGLPALLHDDSVRVDAKGTAQASITGIEVKRSFLSQSADQRVKEIDTEIRQLERAMGLLEARKSGLVAERTFIDSIKVAWGERVSHQLAVGKPTSVELNEAIGFVGTNTTRTEELQRDIDQEKQAVQDKLDALRRKRQEAAGSGRKESKTVEISVDTRKEGSLTLELSAVISNATWQPEYDVRLAADGSTAELTYRAQVRQQTGEDWNDVKLTLSTARPAAGGAPPELLPWRVAFYRPFPPAMPAAAPMRTYKKAARMEMKEALAEASGMDDEVAAPAVFQTAQTISEGTTIAFAIPKPVIISSDNSQHNTVIAIERLPVSTSYLTVPKLSPVAYLTAELTNRAAWPFLPGGIKIFSGNTYVGSGRMKQVAPGEKFNLPFGSDDRITVKREEQKQHREAGMFGKNRMGYRTTVTIANFRSEPQTITIKDQLPLAGDSEISVHLQEASLQPAEKKDDGTLLWKLQLSSGEKKELTYEIGVEYPKDREISGL